jgi:hypothetical protein
LEEILAGNDRSLQHLVNKAYGWASSKDGLSLTAKGRFLPISKSLPIYPMKNESLYLSSRPKLACVFGPAIGFQLSTLFSIHRD